MKQFPVVRLLIAAVIYTALYVLGSSCGLIHGHFFDLHDRVPFYLFKIRKNRRQLVVYDRDSH